MKDVIIQRLSDRQELLEPVIALLTETWPDYYGEDGPDNAHSDVTAATIRNGLPVIFVGTDASDNVVATGALKEASIPSHAHLSPWLAGLATRENVRRQGVGERLVIEIENEARGRGINTIYCATYNAIGIVERRGWQRFDEELEQGTLYGLYLKNL